jgi:predicted phage-related endonuclease
MSEPARTTDASIIGPCEVREITSIGEWLQWRLPLVTASSIGALFGIHPHVSLDDLVAEKRGQRRGEGDNASMRAGRILEPAVIAAVNEEKPEWRVVKATTFHLIPELRLGCTPDAFGADDLLVQCKTCSAAVWDAWRGTAPIHYLLQTLTEMLVCQRQRGVLAIVVRSPSFPLHLFDVPRHPAAEARILDAVASFWSRWDAGEHPQPQTAAGLAELVSDGSHRDFSGDNELMSLLAERAELVPVRRDAEKRIDEIDGAIKERLGPASTAWCPGWSLTFKSQTRKETVLPERTFRVLRVRAVDEQEAPDAATE